MVSQARRTVLNNKYAKGFNQALGQLAVPIGAVCIVLLLILPVPALLLDLLIIANIIGALIILMRVMFIKRPLDFSVFPSVLLLMTLFRVGLSVASTRLILSEAHAGKVIEVFGQLTVAGNMIIGFVVFLILMVIQFLVITKGAERVAQVGARFTLDAMQGKQSAIDVDFSQGRLTDEEARTKRAEIVAESDFYGSMDGASSFVKGDAIVGLIIIVINLIAGVCIGAFSHGMPIGEALHTYALLTIGDGLVTQIPAFLMAAATGMIVTRASSEQDLGTVAGQQLTASPYALIIPGAVSLCLSLVPGMPFYLLLPIAAGLIFAGYRKLKAEKAKAMQAPEAGPSVEAPSLTGPEKLLEGARTVALEIRLASDLARLETESKSMAGQIVAARRTSANRYGFVFPTIRLISEDTLDPGTYMISVHNVPMAHGTAPANQLFARGGNLQAVTGTDAVDPVFMEEGKWIPSTFRISAELEGAHITEPSAMIISHLNKVVMDNASKLLSREDVALMNDNLKAHSASVVDGLIPNTLTLAELHQVLKSLLHERVPLTNLEAIYDALTIAASKSKTTESLVEAARTAVSSQLAAEVATDGVIAFIQLDENLELKYTQALNKHEGQSVFVIDQSIIDYTIAKVFETYSTAYQEGHDLVLVTGSGIRPAMARLIRQQGIPVPVLSFEEVTSANFKLNSFGKVAHAPGNVHN